MKFTKPPISIQDQIALLQQRGLVIPDAERAAHYLTHVGYYRLRAYWLPFEEERDDGTHRVLDGFGFEDALALYVFDRKLRLLVMDAIERFEVSIRASWANALAMSYGSHAYLDATLFADVAKFADCLSSLKREIDRSHETFVLHYKKKYDDPELPPIWMVREIVSIGQLSKWFGNLKHRSDRKTICAPYGLAPEVMESVLHHVTHIRNFCAHHSRLWNRSFTITMKLPKHPAGLAVSMNLAADRQLYNTLVVLGWLLQSIAPRSTWRQRLVQLLADFPKLNLQAMGFPADWTERPIWKEEP